MQHRSTSSWQAYYKRVYRESTSALKAHFTGLDGQFSPPPPGSCIPTLQNEMTVHHSFDFAQQVIIHYLITHVQHLATI